jgi:hypothetical protein
MRAIRMKRMRMMRKMTMLRCMVARGSRCLWWGWWCGGGVVVVLWWCGGEVDVGGVATNWFGCVYSAGALVNRPM